MTSCLAKRPILIVEDELLIALDLADSFQAAGAYAITALSLSQAFELLDGHDWAGAVLDFRLDEQDCSPLCEWLHSLAIPFVICTGLDDITGPAVKGVQVMKPANSDEIVRILERLAAARIRRPVHSDAAAPDHACTADVKTRAGCSLFVLMAVSGHDHERA
jgi:DNA-binding response OmpR family regulator